MERNAIIQKIRKLMELQLSAENVGQSGEAFAAANAIHKLLTKYNLSLDEITSGEDDEQDGLYISPKMQAHDEYGNWRDILMVKLAERNYCRNLGYVKQPSIMMVVGKKENVEIVIQLYNRWKSKINSWEEKHANREGRIKVEVDIKEEDAYTSGIVEGRNTRLYQEIK